MARTKSDLFRELLKCADYIKSICRYPETGIVDIVLAGRVDINIEQLTEVLKKGKYKLQRNFNSIAPEYIDSLGDFLSDIHEEEDVPEFVCTTLRLKDTESPPLENSDIEAPRRDPLDAEFVAARRDAACSGCSVNTEEDEDDIADEYHTENRIDD